MSGEIIIDSKFIQEMEKYREPNKDLGLFGACSENVNVFAEHMLGIRPYSWQVYFLNQLQSAAANGNKDQKEFVAITSRQIGKSTAVAIFSLWAVVFNKYPGTTGNNTLVGITSASDIQAKKLLGEMRKLLHMGDIHMRDKYQDEDGKPKFGTYDAKGKYVGMFEMLLSDKDPNNTQQITFKAHETKFGEYFLKDSRAGSVIKSYAPTSSILGETFSVVIIDEAGKTDKVTDEFFYEYIYPTGNSTNAIRVYTSTPWVSSGFFYRMVDPDSMYGDSPADISLFSIDAIKHENPKYYQTVKKSIDQLNKDGKVDEVQRAYYCRFVKGDQNYFEPGKVHTAFDPSHSIVPGTKDECDMGVDFGGETSSKTVITISRLTNDDIVERLYHKAYEVGKDMTLIEDIEHLCTKFNIQRIVPDDCPAGWYRIKEMRQKGWNVEPMTFKTDKVKKYGAFRNMLNKHLIRSYPDDDLKTEMLAMEFSQGQRSTLIRHAPGYSDDLIDSWVMSAYFFLQEDEGVKFYDY